MGFYELGNGCDSCAPVTGSQSFNNNVVQNQNNDVSQTNALLASIGVGQPNVSVQMGGQQNAAQMAQQPVVQHYQPPAQPVKVVAAPEKVAVQSMNKKMVGKTTQQGPALSLNIPSSVFLLNFGLVILAALAINECCKYYINKTIQLDNGSPLYFAGYAGLIVLLGLCVYVYCQRNM